MKVLLVGAGAVGQSYGRHFQRGGAEVTFWVREKYAEEVRAGFTLYPINEQKMEKGGVRFSTFDVMTQLSEVATRTWDCVVLCISSTALKRGEWFAEMAAVIGEATLLNLTPGMEDKKFIEQSLPSAQIVSGLIGLLSYPGPLPGETLPEPGMVYWIPPFTKMTFSGPKERCQKIIKVLNDGGLPSKEVKNTNEDIAFKGSLLQLYITALELSGWSFSAFRRDKKLLNSTFSAVKESFLVAENVMEVKTPSSLRFLRSWMISFALLIAPVFVPFDLERFLEKHFTKVGDQTADILKSTIQKATELQIKHSALDELLRRLVEKRS